MLLCFADFYSILLSYVNAQAQLRGGIMFG